MCHPSISIFSHCILYADYIFRKASNEMNKPRKPTVTSHDDPFLVFETTLSTASSESFLDSLEQMSKLNNSKGTSGSSSTSPLLRPPPKSANASNSSKDSFKYLS